MRRIALLLLCLFSFLLAPARAFAHAADEDYNLTTTCDLYDDRLEQTVYIPAWFLVNELYGEQTTLKSLAGREGDCKAQIVGWMAYNNPVLADGAAVKPEVLKMEARSNAWPENQPFPAFAADSNETDDTFMKHSTGVKITLRYPLKKIPAALSIRWRRYMVRTTPDGALSQPPVTIAFFHDEKHRIADLTPQEPEWVWHSDAVAPPPESAKVSQKWEPVKWRIPVGALVVAFGGLAAALVVGRRNRMIAALVLCADLGLAAYAWQADIAVVVADSPFQKQLARPDQAQAQVIFRDLLQGVYKAFDFNKDSDVYDALAADVDGPLLEQIYKDVHGSLVMDDSEGGGAVCQVEKVEVQKAELLPASDKTGTELRLACAWIVRGKVSHWGHTHVRANAYEAEYTLAPRAGSDGPRWKITGCKVTMQKPMEVEPPGASVTK